LNIFAVRANSTSQFVRAAVIKIHAETTTTITDKQTDARVLFCKVRVYQYA